MHPLPPSKAGLPLILADQATSGGVQGPNPSPGTSKGSIPRPFPRPCSLILLGDFKGASYPLKVGPKFGTWPVNIKEGQGLNLQIEAEDTFGHPKGKIWPSMDHKDHILKGLEVQVTSLKSQVERILDLELQVSSLAWVIKALQEQVQGRLAARSFPTSSHRSLPLPVLVSRQM
ncbi:hypothetical protein PAXRUDRAFT_19061 [Paxillus rubicundulus Ve08.2h10]|uniref:Uncharacterized protein n=1 Tax=Paxillus rubicundulus Ve08.2h10 TaxID=930991 RepID=A0A0D0D5M9_9AGAM|nr:hypothetical protein PAXRUDRAFT_19061 [Paxillus rubicundulus Ve08.2h10]